jgi:predicted P-loop ATPase
VGQAAAEQGGKKQKLVDVAGSQGRISAADVKLTGKSFRKGRPPGLQALAEARKAFSAMATISQNDAKSYYYPRLDPQNLENIPATLKRLLTWVAWREEPQPDNPDAKPRKVPVNPRTGKNAKSNQPSTGGTYEGALAYYERYPGIRGIGFILSEDEEICGIDIDNCVNPDTGEIEANALALARFLDSFTEYTPSNGIRILVLARLSPGAGTKFIYKGETHEIYDRLRFLTVTGRRVPNTPAAIWDRQQVIDSLLPLSARAAKPAAPPDRAGDPLAKTVDDIEDREIIAVIEASKQGEKFRSLYSGDTTGYSGYFAATGALCVILAQYTRLNPERIDRIARSSGLITGWEKWWDEVYGDRRTRGERTISAACALASTMWRYAPPGKYLVNKTGDVKAILANAITAIRDAPEFAGVLAYNELSLFIVTREPAPWQKTAGNWEDHDSIRLSEWLQRKGIYVNSNLATEAAVAVARENPFHPIKEYLEKTAWDAKPRLDDWLTTYLGAKSTPYTRAIAPRWMISAIARIYDPGCRVDHTLTLEGPQGKRKSTALETLCGKEFFSDNLGDLTNKDSLIGLHGVWIIEFAELDAIRRTAQVERVKSFLTSPTDFFRPPYERICKHVPRTNVFAASTNATTYLADETGNRRFWPVKCGTINIDKLKEDRDQLWAEARARYLEGKTWWLEKDDLEKLAATEQDDRYEPGRWDNEIVSWISNPTKRTESNSSGNYKIPTAAPFDSEPGRVTISDILVHCVGKPLEMITKNDQNDVARCLRHYGWVSRKRGNGDQRRAWFKE